MSVKKTKISTILDPKITHKDLYTKSLDMDIISREQVLKQLDLYRAIYNMTGKIERPDFEGGTNLMVRKKYVPNSKHETFFRAANQANGHGRWLLGGNRSGKTETGIREDISFSMGFRPFFERSDEAFFTPIPPPTRGRIFCEDWEKAAKGTIVPKLFAVVPPELIKSVRKNQMGVEYFWELWIPFDATKAISTVEIVTNKADVRSIEGWRGDWIHFDEPTRKNMFIAATRGLVDTDGFFWFTLTPLNEPWILDDIIQKVNPKTGDKAYTGEYVTSYENIFDPKTGSGFLTEEGIDSFASKLTEIEKRTRLLGEFAHLSGRVYDEFDPNIHLYPNEHIKMDTIPETWWRDVFIDPARRKPHCVAFVAWSPEGEMFLYDGFRIGDTRYSGDFNDVIPAVPTITELVSEIKKRCDPYPQRFFIDSMADTPDLATGDSLYDLLSDEFPIEKWPKIDKEDQIAYLRTLMTPNKLTGQPKFFMYNMLTRAHYEIERYRWDEYKSEARAYKPKVIKTDDDYVDCLMAAAMLPPPDFDRDEITIPKVHFKY